MRPILKFICMLLPLSSLVSSCSNASNNELKTEYIYGRWTCKIMGDEYIGIDTLWFRNDSTFFDTQTLTYKASDSGFEFQTRFDFNISGKWQLKSDSVFIYYDSSSIDLRLDPETFTVTAANPNADTTKMISLKEDMSKDLSAYLSSTFKNRYNEIADRDILLGRVNYITPDSMSMTNGSNRLILYRVTK